MKKRTMALLCVATILLAACGDDGPSEEGTGTTTSATTASVADDTTPAGEEPGTDASADVGGPDDFTPGPVSFRLVHLAESVGAVDVYAFTSQGMVEEFLLESGVEPGTVLEDLRPPADGSVVVFPAGTTDLDTFGNEDLVAEARTANSDAEGDRRILLIADDDRSGTGYEAVTYWEDADQSMSGNSNALPPASADRGLVIMASAGGGSVYVAPPGAGACLAPEPPQTVETAVGGTVVQAFAVTEPTVQLALHSFDDQDFDCAGEPVHDFSVEVAPGERVFVLVHGDGADGVDTLVLPLGGG